MYTFEYWRNVYSSSLFIFFKDFIYLFERDLLREITSRQRGRQRERSRLPAEQRAWYGDRSQDSEFMTWAEGSSLTLWATQAPLFAHFLTWLSFYLSCKNSSHSLNACSLYMTCKYFLPFSGLSFDFVNGVLGSTKLGYFGWVPFICLLFFLSCLYFGVWLRSRC